MLLPTDGHLCLSALADQNTISMGMQLSVWCTDLTSVAHISRSGVGASQGRSGFSFEETHHTVIYNDYILFSSDKSRSSQGERLAYCDFKFHFHDA